MTTKTLITLTLLVTVVFAGCVDSETGPETTTHEGLQDAAASYDDPQPATVTGLEFVTQTTDASGGALPSGAGIWAFGDFVFGSALRDRFWIADVSDPENPVVVYQAPDSERIPYGRDADLIVHEDGRRTLVIATQFDGMHFFDVTDPTAPAPLSVALFDPEAEDNPAVHNIAVIPGTQYVFNSQSGGAGNSNDLLDASDPADPVVLGTFGTHGCHDISFFGNPDSGKFRAYCAGIERTEIWDMDGFDPSAADFGISVIATIGCPEIDQNDPEAPDLSEVQSCAEDSPATGNPALGGGAGPLRTRARTLHHLAVVNEDASVLIIGDEYNGGGSPGACYYYDEQTGESSPLGALWFYDISDETTPSLLSWLSAPSEDPDSPEADPEAEPDPEDVDPTDPTDPAASNVPGCTAHFGTLVPGEEKLVMAWYIAGVILIDFTDPEDPVILDQVKPDGVDVWDARVHNGYVFTGDINRGMDVFRLI